ncbi:flagellin [Opacimonas viscosa]|uniref:Flagellin n=1 Tax=Opacimonas viscosa TaxID=2961944 RepID=A0AA41WWG5_9ALTE|nr:flagellin [Opacimonas viscosa]MCP3427812.1 flagellin [Opacimonas viscosa]
MSIYVNTNMSSITARRQLIDSSNSLNTAFERLSSGFRINSAKDDAAGLQISDRMTSQIEGLQQGIRNANDGISLAQTIEGSLQESSSALQRIRQLTIQAQSGINTDADLDAIQKEIGALKDEISRIASTSQFNGVNVLTGDFKASFLVGSNAGQTIDINLSKLNGFGYNGLFSGFDIDVKTNASTSLARIDAALSTINGTRSDLGAIQNRFDSTIRNLTNIAENVSAARSRIRDTDFATETAELTRSQIIQQATTTILTQANQKPQAALSLLQG